MKSTQVVSPHQPDEIIVWVPLFQLTYERHGVLNPPATLHITHHHPRRSDGAADRLKPGFIASSLVPLDRVLRRDKPPDSIQTEPSHGRYGDMHMSAMNRVETAAEQSDRHARCQRFAL